jgi:hypothetical protein
MGRTNASKRRSAASQRSRTTRTPIRKRFETSDVKKELSLF